ncbi:MAG: YceI family protein [Oligoflexales bacterium]
MRVFVFAATFMLGSLAYGQQHSISPASSKLTWEGSKVVGGGHQGSLKIKEGFIKFKEKQPLEAQVLVDMTSITNSDLKDPKWNQKLVGHLHSDDFFSTAKYPESKIVLTDFSKQKNGQYKVKGKLTIKGITKPVELQGKMIEKAGSVSALTASLEFDRTEFNVRYGSGKFFENLGDKMIADVVKVQVELKLEKPIKTASN